MIWELEHVQWLKSDEFWTAIFYILLGWAAFGMAMAVSNKGLQFAYNTTSIVILMRSWDHWNKKSEHDANIPNIKKSVEDLTTLEAHEEEEEKKR